MDRRALLSLCVTAICTWSGCLGGGERPAPRIAWIWLVNDRERAQEIEVTIEDDGEVVFSETHQVGTEPDAANVRIDDPVDGPGQYVVRARLDGSVREVVAAEFVDGDENCIGVRFSLLDGGSVDYWTKSMREC